MKFTSWSGLESCAPIGLNPDSLPPSGRRAKSLSHQSLDLRPWQHTLCPVRVSPVLTPAGHPVQIPPPPEAWPRLLLPWRRARSWVMGSTSPVGLGGLGPGSQAPPLSPLAAAPWRPSWGWRAAVSSLPSQSVAFSTCRCVGQAPPCGDHRRQGGVLVGLGAVCAVPPASKP